VTELLWRSTAEAIEHLRKLRAERDRRFAERASIAARIGDRTRAAAGQALVELLSEVAQLNQAQPRRTSGSPAAAPLDGASKLLSVLMTGWRTSQWIEAAMASVLSQSMPAGWTLELLVGVDGCPQTLAAARRVRDPRVVVVELAENGGTYRALNTLLTFARGTLIAILDSDDVASPDRFRLQIEHLEGHPELDFVGGQFLQTDANLARARPGEPLPADIGAAFRSGASAYACHGTLTARRSVYDALGGYDDTRVGGDWELVLRALGRGLRGENLAQPVLRRRQHDAQLTRAPGTGVGSALRESYRARLRADEARYRRGEVPPRIAPAARTRVRGVHGSARSTLVVMPTIPERVASAGQVISTLLAQGPTRMVVLLNGHGSSSGLPDDPRVEYVKNPPGTGPASRLDVDTTGFDVVVHVDDDIVYPPDYLERCRADLDRYGPGAIVSYHGRYWPKGATAYRDRQVLHFTAATPRPWRVPTGAWACPRSPGA
ncbi:MAG: glycosyltransferase, partial [Myxococcales bacterium]|nr:glycosyltransferase [Myxococcales bacterium]